MYAIYYITLCLLSLYLFDTIRMVYLHGLSNMFRGISVCVQYALIVLMQFVHFYVSYLLLGTPNFNLIVRLLLVIGLYYISTRNYLFRTSSIRKWFLENVYLPNTDGCSGMNLHGTEKIIDSLVTSKKINQTVFMIAPHPATFHQIPMVTGFMWKYTKTEMIMLGDILLKYIPWFMWISGSYVSIEPVDWTGTLDAMSTQLPVMIVPGSTADMWHTTKYPEKVTVMWQTCTRLVDACAEYNRILVPLILLNPNDALACPVWLTNILEWIYKKTSISALPNCVFGKWWLPFWNGDTVDHIIFGEPVEIPSKPEQSSELNNWRQQTIGLVFESIKKAHAKYGDNFVPLNICPKPVKLK